MYGAVRPINATAMLGDDPNMCFINYGIRFGVALASALHLLQSNKRVLPSYPRLRIPNWRIPPHVNHQSFDRSRSFRAGSILRRKTRNGVNRGVRCPLHARRKYRSPTVYHQTGCPIEPCPPSSPLPPTPPPSPEQDRVSSRDRGRCSHRDCVGSSDLYPSLVFIVYLSQQLPFRRIHLSNKALTFKSGESVVEDGGRRSGGRGCKPRACITSYTHF